MDKAELNERKMSSAYHGSLKCRRLKKTMKDKCLVIGETTMYYGNFGSVQLWSPIPGSPNLDNEPDIINIRPDSPKEAALPLQRKHQATPKNTKGKKPTSQKKMSTPTDKKNTSAKYPLPPLRAAPASVSNSRCLPRVSRGREPCDFKPSRYIERRGNYLMSAYAWIPQPGFKPSEKKTTPKNAFTSESSSIKYGSLGKLLEPTKGVNTSSSLVMASLDGVRLPAIRGATRASETQQILPPTAQYINIYKDDGHLPPTKVRSMTIANKGLEREYHKTTKGYKW
ncbi:uncharacterized protein LOC110456179 [Mizuhopecten yessoensis]|uniref:uncharacterized protein LOC110456179 n=1 Tax=Mizuhopecten yessoensis TaxID=6573 RepID=UPI000B45EAC2|nr:uncharacterized protein LOC110456179 [Mizuhopecten yessoensis]